MNVRSPALPPAGPAASRESPASPRPSRPSGPEPAADPRGSLWEILTPEEREFFARGAALGPITYRPGGAPGREPDVPTGRRVDVRG